MKIGGAFYLRSSPLFDLLPSCHSVILTHPYKKSGTPLHGKGSLLIKSFMANPGASQSFWSLGFLQNHTRNGKY